MLAKFKLFDASAKFRRICQSAVLVKFKIPQTRIGAVLNDAATRCVKFYYFARATPNFEMASAGRNFKIPPRVGI